MKFIDIHTHNNVSDTSVLSILNNFPNSETFTIPFSIGMHPWHINKETIEDELIAIKKKLSSENCYAIGECGLDKLSKVAYDLQLTVFKEHIKLSETYKKPLIIHCVRSFQEIISLKKKLKPTQKWIIHGFRKNKQVATSLLKNDCFLSFGNPLLTSTKLQEVFLDIPLDKLFFETDEAKINIATIYKKAALLKNMTNQEIKKSIHQNFNNIFIT